MLIFRSALMRLTNWLRRGRRSFLGGEGLARSQRLTVMLVPSTARGKPLQFQTTKRTLLTVLSIVGVSTVLGFAGTVYLLRSALKARRAAPAWVGTLNQQTEISSLREENRQLKGALKAQIDETRQRITKVNHLIGRISAFTGLPLEAPTSATVALTSGSAELMRPEPLGRGGPLSPEPRGLVTEDLVGHGLRGYVNARDMQVYELDSIITRLDRTARHFGDQETLLATTPLICPVQGEYVFTDRFGKRIHPLYRRVDFHSGLDISAPYRTPIVAPADGKVTYSGYDKAKGMTLTIDHGVGLYPRDGVPSKGRFQTRYFHCARVLVKTGTKVKRGDVIALVGSSGTSTGNHCHYEVMVDNHLVDPEYLILNGQ